MKLHLAHTAGQNMFTGYGTGYVVVNAARHENHLLVAPDQVISWNISGFDALDAGHVAQFIALQPEIVILGTGATLRFPHPEFSRQLAAAGIGFEVMDSKAACRTYNVLMAEGRRVLAAILLA